MSLYNRYRQTASADRNINRLAMRVGARTRATCPAYAAAGGLVAALRQHGRVYDPGHAQAAAAGGRVDSSAAGACRHASAGGACQQPARRNRPLARRMDCGAASAGRARHLVLTRRRLRFGLAAHPPGVSRSPVTSHAGPRAGARLSTGARARVPCGAGGRMGGVLVAPKPGHCCQTHRGSRRLGRWRLNASALNGTARCRGAAAGCRHVLLALGGPGLDGQFAAQEHGDGLHQRRNPKGDGTNVSWRPRSIRPAGLAVVWRFSRAAAAVGAGGFGRIAVRRRAAPGAQCAAGGCRRAV